MGVPGPPGDKLHVGAGDLAGPAQRRRRRRRRRKRSLDSMDIDTDIQGVYARLMGQQQEGQPLQVSVCVCVRVCCECVSVCNMCI